ncbi:MAG: glycoside hydrolase family 71/99-like protein, partial [Planctomycetales bacterium]
KYPTGFLLADGTAASVFSSHRRKTVLRHFRWMRDYGIDGAFVQRFAVETRSPKNLRHFNAVLRHCREGANTQGRAYALMYDLSGLRKGQMEHVVADWKMLRDKMKLGQDAGDRAYLHHNDKPVVGVWGVGFNDGRGYTLGECDRLIDFLKNDPTHGGCAVVLGVPTGWRTLDRDSIRDDALHRVILKADVICPWSVGRFASRNQVSRFAEQRWKPDAAWSQRNNKDYLPVVFPGFSWHNMKPESPLNLIPREQGRFLWKQFVEVKKSGAEMIYVAMFDEIDEATAIFKCTNQPPVGASKFLTHEGLPSDHYLWLTGMGGKLLRGEIQATEKIPPRR